MSLPGLRLQEKCTPACVTVLGGRGRCCRKREGDWTFVCFVWNAPVLLRCAHPQLRCCSMLLLFMITTFLPPKEAFLGIFLNCPPHYEILVLWTYCVSGYVLWFSGGPPTLSHPRSFCPLRTAFTFWGGAVAHFESACSTPTRELIFF